MADEIIFYTHPESRGRTVRWMLEEVGAPYRTELLGWEGVKSPSFLAVNPMGKVPTIVHRGTVVTETAAICAYLADAFPDAGLAPQPGSPERGTFLRWLFFTAGSFEYAVFGKMMGFAVPAERERSIGFGNLGGTLDALECAVRDREFIAGDRFTACDLYVAANLGFCMMMGAIDKRPAFEAFVGRHLARPASQRAIALDGEAAEAMKTG